MRIYDTGPENCGYDRVATRGALATGETIPRIGAIIFLGLGLAMATVLCTSSAFAATPALINGVYDLPNLGCA